jgi:hypothetical protein
MARSTGAISMTLTPLQKEILVIDTAVTPENDDKVCQN